MVHVSFYFVFVLLFLFTFPYIVASRPCIPFPGSRSRFLHRHTSPTAIRSRADRANLRSTFWELGRVIQSCALEIAVTPQLAPFTFGDEAANAGEMATVQCAAIKGDLPLRIVWSLNGRPVDVGRVSNSHDYDTPDIVVTRSSKRISTLTIDSVAARHAGEYKCAASNAAGSVSHTSVLSVNGTIYGFTIWSACNRAGEPCFDWLVGRSCETARRLRVEVTSKDILRAFSRVPLFRIGTLFRRSYRVDSIAAHSPVRNGRQGRKLGRFRVGCLHRGQRGLPARDQLGPERDAHRRESPDIRDHHKKEQPAVH